MSVRRQPPDPEVLLEAATGAYRDRDRDGRIIPSPAWADLSIEERSQLFDRQVLARLVEQATDPTGLASTSRAVLERIRGLGQL
jgi:hypothetical protein